MKARSRLPVLQMRGEVATSANGREVVYVDGRAIPVIGYVNCTGHPLPGDAENFRRITEYLHGVRQSLAAVEEN